jgi:nicotinamidase-related amidase
LNPIRRTQASLHADDADGIATGDKRSEERRSGAGGHHAVRYARWRHRLRHGLFRNAPYAQPGERAGLLKPRQDVFPEQKPIDRTFIKTWEETRVVDAVKKTGRKKIIMAALWSEICLAMPAILAAGVGYEVYAVTDASGGVSAEAHGMAIRRMVMAGVVPITGMAVAGELQRDWARQEQAAAMAQVFLEHGGNTGIALAWELQLLGQKGWSPIRNRALWLQESSSMSCSW